MFLLIIVLFGGVKCLDLHSFYEYLNKSESASTECEAQREIFLEALEKRETWALQSKIRIVAKLSDLFSFILVVDAFGRIPQAITQGNLLDLGTYDQCVDINEQVNNVDIKGKYCLYGLAVSLSLESSYPENKVIYD